MKREDVTLKDLAKQLHLGVSTVSKALNNYPSVNEYTKERVKALAKQLNYVPNETAVNLKKKTTFTAGVIVPTLDDPFYIDVVNGIEDYIKNFGYNVIISQSRDNFETEQKLVEFIKLKRVDGLLIAVSKNSTNHNHITQLQNIGIPVVFFVRSVKDKQFFSVNSNYQQGMDEAISFLIKRGHRKIAFINGPAALHVSIQRELTYLTAIRQHNLVQESAIVKYTNFEKESIQNAMEELLATDNHPTAIITFKCMMCLEAIKYLQTHRNTLLNAIEFISFGDSPYLEYVDRKPIAIIKEQPYAIGMEASKIMLQLINKTISISQASRILLDCHLDVL